MMIYIAETPGPLLVWFLSNPLTSEKERKHESRKSNDQKSSSTRQIKSTKAIREKKLSKIYIVQVRVESKEET